MERTIIRDIIPKVPSRYPERGLSIFRRRTTFMNSWYDCTGKLVIISAKEPMIRIGIINVSPRRIEDNM